MRLLILACLIPLPAFADCAGETLVNCLINGNQLEVCNNGDLLTYSYGPPGAPELQLASKPEEAFTPWDGMGRTEWEAITFSNKAATYEVVFSIDKMDESAGPEWGVVVEEGGEILANLTCETTAQNQRFTDLYQQIEAKGLCWDRATASWAASCSE
jgi:hypothetical protein